MKNLRRMLFISSFTNRNFSIFYLRLISVIVILIFASGIHLKFQDFTRVDYDLEAEIGLILKADKPVHTVTENLIESIKRCQDIKTCRDRIQSKGEILLNKRKLESRALVDVPLSFVFLGLQTSQWLSLGMVIICVTSAALTAGLIMGLLSLDVQEMTIKARRGNGKESEMARQVKPLILRRHQLLVTLLLFNSLANESLPTFLEDIFSTNVAIVCSVFLVLFFGEMIPSAVFTGPQKLQIAASFVWLVKPMLWVLCPVAYPLSKLLDLMAPHENHRLFSRDEISLFVEMQARERMKSLESSPSPIPTPIPRSRSSPIPCAGSPIPTSPEQQFTPLSLGREFSLGSNCSKSFRTGERFPNINDGLSERSASYRLEGYIRKSRESADSSSRQGSLFDSFAGACEYGLSTEEVAMITGLLNISRRQVSDFMVAPQKVFCISAEAHLDIGMMAGILASGSNRVPVYEGSNVNNITGFLLVKRLIAVSPKDCRRVGSFYLHKPVVISAKATVLELLRAFKKCRSHLALVYSTKNSPRYCNEMVGGTRALDKQTVGIVTVEDILKQVLQEDLILDESDTRLSFILHREHKAESLLLGYVRRFKLRKLNNQIPKPGPAHSESQALQMHTFIPRTSKKSYMSIEMHSNEV